MARIKRKKKKNERLQAFGVGVLVIVLFAIPMVFQWGGIENTWAHALGNYRTVSATIVGRRSQATLSRACSDEVRIDATWSGGPAPGAGWFLVCRNEASRYPDGKQVRAVVKPGDAWIGVDESRGNSIFSAIIQALVGFGGLVFVVACFRTAFKPRFRPAAPM